MIRVAFVIQRFGPDILGGAEMYCRNLALQIKLLLGWDVDIYTTRSIDYQRWDNSKPEGLENDQGLRVYRFSTKTKNLLLFSLYKRAFRIASCVRIPDSIMSRLEKLWFRLQGPVCPDMISALTSSSERYTAIFAFTYLYYPAQATAQRLSDKTVLVPFAHAEDPFFFQQNRVLFKTARWIIPCSDSERSLIVRTFPDVVNRVLRPAGSGLNLSDSAAQRVRNPPKKFILYLGRVSKGKGLNQLLTDFKFLRTQFQNVELVLAGRIERGMNLQSQPGIHYLGFVSSEERSRLLSEAVALVNPSSHESLSLVVLEAVAMGCPVIANAHCEVFVDLASKLKTVLLYSSKEELLQAYSSITIQEDSRQWMEMIQESQKFIQANYSWDRTIQIYANALSKVSRQEAP